MCATKLLQSAIKRVPHALPVIDFDLLSVATRHLVSPSRGSENDEFVPSRCFRATKY